MLEIAILILSGFITWKVIGMSEALERLRQEVAENESAVESALTLINGLSSRLREAAVSGDNEAISQLADELDATNVKLATAVAENSAAAEDSDSFYDPAPIGEEHVEEDVPSSDDESETSSEDTGVNEEANSSSSTESDSSAQPAEVPSSGGGGEDSQPSDSGEVAGENAVTGDAFSGNSTDSTTEASAGSETDESSSSEEGPTAA